MRIAFYGCQTYPFNPEDVYAETGVGGSELSLVYLARELAKRNQVAVYVNATKTTTYDGVYFAPIDQFFADEYWDVVVAFRGPLPPKANCRAMVHWTIDPGGPFLIDDLPRTDGIISISHYQAGTIQGIPPEKIRVIRLFVDPVEYAEELPKDPYKLIYCSEPERGLRNLPAIFHLVKQAVPQAELVITFDHTLWRWGSRQTNWEPLVRDIPGIRFLGKLRRPDLIREQKTSSLQVYPADWPGEMFCIAALECQAAGTPTISTDQGALATTVLDGESGILVRTLPQNDPNFHRHFADIIIGLLRDRARLGALQSQARQRALTHYTVAKVAGDWEGYLASLLG